MAQPKNASHRMSPLARNSLFMMAAQMAISLSALISSVLIAQKAGPDLAGKYGYIVWLGGTLTTIVTLGVPNALTKFTADFTHSKRKSTIGELNFHLLLLALCSGLLASLALIALNALGLFPASIPEFSIYTVAALLPLNAISYSIMGSLRGSHSFNVILKWNAVQAVLSFSVLLTIIAGKIDIRALTLYYAAFSVLNFAIPVFLARRLMPLRFNFMGSAIRREVVTYIASVSVIILLDQVVWDKSEAFFLGRYASASQIAFYTIAYTLTRTIMTVFPGAILHAMLPRIAELQGVRDMRSINETFQSALRYVGIIVMAIAGGGIALAQPFIVGVYGQAYADMIPVFSILICSAAWATVVGVGSTVLYGMTKQTFLLKLTACMAVFNLTMDLLVIPKYGAIGAAISNAAVQGLGGSLTLWYMHRWLDLRFPVFAYLRLLLCGGLAAGLAVVLRVVMAGRLGNILALVIFGLLFVLVYGAMIFALRLLRTEEVPLLNKLPVFADKKESR